MVDRLWTDVKELVRTKIETGDTLVRTKAQGCKFWLCDVTDNLIRVKRERSKLLYEDIPRRDFADIWQDLSKIQHMSTGYAQRDLQEGQNRRSALSFALVGMLPYVEWRKIGRAWKLFLVQEH